MAPRTKKELEQGSAPAPEQEEKASGVPDSVAPSGQFQVLQFGDKVRLFNPDGKAVSPVHGLNETSEATLGSNGKPALQVSLLNKMAARFNVQLRNSKAVPPKKKNPLAEEAQRQLAEQEASEEA